MLSDKTLTGNSQEEEESALQKLIRIVTKLDTVQVELLTEVATVRLRQVEETVDSESDIVTPRFAANFRNRLLIRHATNESKMTKKAFEYAFKGACEADGKTGFITVSNTFSGVDVTINGERFSLKTEASRDIKAGQITISKFIEARWIQQQTALEGLVKEATTRIPAHLVDYDPVLVLRVHELSSVRLRYEIVEIPRDLLRSVSTLTVADFTPRSAQGGSSAKVKVDGKQMFTLRLDGSDGKVTLAGIQIGYCLRHVSWVIPTVAPAPEEAEPSLFAPAETPPRN